MIMLLKSKNIEKDIDTYFLQVNTGRLHDAVNVNF